MNLALKDANTFLDPTLEMGYTMDLHAIELVPTWCSYQGLH